jgi:hypothetical protein
MSGENGILPGSEDFIFDDEGFELYPDCYSPAMQSTGTDNIL